MISCHQYIDRETSTVKTEPLIADRWVSLLYSTVRENSRFLFDLLTSPRSSAFLAAMNYDMPFTSVRSMVRHLEIDLSECLAPEELSTPRKVFERQIRYWERRPLPEPETAVLSPADARVLAGSLKETSGLFIKEKFFGFEELLGTDKKGWHAAFGEGDFAVFRLTPEKYHFTHVPVTGEVKDFYCVEGACHSCNPGAVVSMVTPFSKNRRFVTVIDTDVPGGSGIGLVAMVEVVALMIGAMVQCYSREKYDAPVSMTPGLWVERGQPKGLFRPGSSVVVLLFQENRIAFSQDILENLNRTDARSRFTTGFARPLVETDVRVRSAVACKKGI